MTAMRESRSSASGTEAMKLLAMNTICLSIHTGKGGYFIVVELAMKFWTLGPCGSGVQGSTCD
jgi:hypothetical protein